MSKYCSNCGTEITEETEFCTNCGAAIKVNSKKNTLKKIDEINLVEESLNQPNKGLRISKVLIGVVILTALFLIAKSFLVETEPSEKPFSVLEQLSKLEGKWYDPTGVVLGDKAVIVVFKRKGDVITGKDEKGLFEVKITPFGANNYQAQVVLRGVKGDFELHFYKEENKLVFFSTVTKSSWYLKKINNKL